MIEIQDELRKQIFDILRKDHDLEPEEIQFSVPPLRKFGDLSTPVPFIIAKRSGEKPFVIGKKLAEALTGETAFISETRIEGGGFLNIILNRKAFLDHLLGKPGKLPQKKNTKVIVEHTSINPNKSAHIGHLRNSSLGDTLARALAFLGYRVEVQNYLDDTGIQVADVVWGLMDHDRKDVNGIMEIENLSSFLWDRYPYYSSKLSGDEQNAASRNRVHKHIENREDPYFSVSSYISEVVVKNHIELMEKINIRYDTLVRESDIIQQKLFDEASGILRKNNIMYLSSDPEKQGCWVIKYRGEDIEKIVIRSNGTSTYIGKDIAYALWKTGMLEKGFHFRDFYSYNDGKTVHMSDQGKKETDVSYGNGDKVFTVIDVRQSYLQKIISEEVIAPLAKKGVEKEYIHFSYEMVALTPACVIDLGFELSDEDRKRPYIEVSGRKGIAVSGDDLINKLMEKSRNEVLRRNPDLPPETVAGIAKDIAVGALRYYMIKFNSNTVISFDFNDALSFEGDTGPYLQYTSARINSIFRKLGGKSGELPCPDPTMLPEEEASLYFDILLSISLIETQVMHAVEKREISAIASFSYQLCQKINQYYHLYPVLSEKDPALRQLRVVLLGIFSVNIKMILNIMGIPVPERM